MAPGQAGHDALIRRVQSEFLEMPGLRLTELQARRLWGLDAPSCAMVLSNLLSSRFLCRTRDGAFIRADSGDGSAVADYAPTALLRRKSAGGTLAARKC